MSQWYDYFKQRADVCGLPFPDSPYKTAAAILGSIKAFTDCYKDLGKDAMKNMPLSTFLYAMRNRAAWDAALKSQPATLAKIGAKLTPRFALGSQVGTGAGAVSAGLGMLASAYIGGLIGCAIYATDKCLGGGLDEAVTSASVGYWEWWYGVEENRRQGRVMEAKLELMKQLRAVALEMGILPSKLADQIGRGFIVSPASVH